jgi:hypothetical protein
MHPEFIFLFGRLLRSRPNAGPDVVQRAKQEFQKEIEIDPKNAVAPLILFDDKRISCFGWAAL